MRRGSPLPLVNNIQMWWPLSTKTFKILVGQHSGMANIHAWLTFMLKYECSDSGISISHLSVILTLPDIMYTWSQHWNNYVTFCRNFLAKLYRQIWKMVNQFHNQSQYYCFQHWKFWKSLKRRHHFWPFWLKSNQKIKR